MHYQLFLAPKVAVFADCLMSGFLLLLLLQHLVAVNERLHKKTGCMGFLTRSDTNWHVQS